MAGEYVEFHNNAQPALNETNVNLMQQLIKQDMQATVSGDTLPVGAIMPFGSDTVPDNWLLCDGSAVSREDYQQLFNTIGTTFGQGDGFTTFNLPDLRDRVPIGKDTTDTDFDTLGKTAGERKHTLTIEEMPEFSVAGIFNITEQGSTLGNGGTPQLYTEGNVNIGGGQSHNITQPSIATNYIIKAQQSAGVVATVVDNLNSTSATNALSANQGRILANKISEYGYISSDQMTTMVIGGNQGRKYDITFAKQYINPPKIVATYRDDNLNAFGLVPVGVSNITTTGCRLIFGADIGSSKIGIDYLIINID